MATTFGWKRKIAQNVTRKRVAAFDDNEQKDEGSLEEPFELDWRLLTKRSTVTLEDNESKGKRLKVEGIALAEKERYWEAIGRWNEALCHIPKDEKIYELKSQALLELNELFPAIQAAQLAVEINPTWATAYQTLGRAQLGFGEVELALRSFSKAVHLKPDDEELWKEDLLWAQELQEQANKRDKLLKQKIAENEAADTLPEYSDAEDSESSATM